MHAIEHLRYVARVTGVDAATVTTEAAAALASHLAFSAQSGIAASTDLVLVLRQLLQRQGAIGPLWDLATRVVLASDPQHEAYEQIRRIREDQTPTHVGASIAPGQTVTIIGWPDLIVTGLSHALDPTVLVIDVEGQATPVLRRLERSGIDAESVDPAHLAGAVEASDVVLIEAGSLTGSGGQGHALVDVGATAAVGVATLSHTPAMVVAGYGRHLPAPYWTVVTDRAFDPDLPAWMQPHEQISLALFDEIITPEGRHRIAEWRPTPIPVAPELLPRR